jgi:hypothetical protein
VADAVDIANKATLDDAHWGSCCACKANRRLDAHLLCYACQTEPMPLQISALTKQVALLEQSHARLKERNRALRAELAGLGPLRSAHFALALTESEHLTLIAIMIDVVAEDPDIPTLAIARKLQAHG